jgi:hypothetical protein
VSKGADDDTEMEAGMTTSERRRRRRRGGGLRIPSDNVPRRTGPVAAPVPEDPAVAMSIAYAFTDEASAPGRLPDELGDLDDATSIAPRPDLDIAADGSAPGVPGVDDVVPDGRTRQMAAVSLEALGLTDVEGALEEDAAHVLNTTGDIDIDVDGIEDAPDEDEDHSGDDFGETEAPIQRRPATIPPPMPVPAQTTSASRKIEIPAQAPAPTPAPTTGSFAAAAAAAAAAAQAERARTDVESPPSRPDSDADADADDDAGGNGVVATRMPRAATVALSEDDLEELLEVTPPPREPPKPPPEATAAPVPVAAAAVPEAISAQTSGAVPFVSVNAQASGAAPVAPSVGMNTGEAEALAEEDLQEVASPSDAGDSGEILAEEIVEVEQEARAPAVPPLAATAATPPAAPPTPPHAHAKPPAAPPAAATKKPLAARHAQAAAASATSSGATEGERSKKRRGKPWFEEVFDEDYLRTLPFLTPQATQAEALMVIESLGVPAGAAVLDVGCGYGRHAMELAARGYHVSASPEGRRVAPA